MASADFLLQFPQKLSMPFKIQCPDSLLAFFYFIRVIHIYSPLHWMLAFHNTITAWQVCVNANTLPGLKNTFLPATQEMAGWHHSAAPVFLGTETLQPPGQGQQTTTTGKQPWARHEHHHYFLLAPVPAIWRFLDISIGRLVLVTKIAPIYWASLHARHCMLYFLFVLIC